MTRMWMITSLVFALPAQADQETLALMPLKVGGGLTQADGDVIADTLGTMLSQKGKFKVLDRSYMAQMMEEKQLQMVTASDDDFIDLAAYAHAAYFLVGSVGRLGSKRILNVRLVDVNTAASVHAERVSWSNPDLVEELLDGLAAKLSGDAKAAVELDPKFGVRLFHKLNRHACAPRNSVRGRITANVAGEVSVSLGRGHGVSDGSVLQVMKGGDVVGEIAVYEVKGSSSKGSYTHLGDTLAGAKKGQPVRPGPLRISVAEFTSRGASGLDGRKAAKQVIAQLKSGAAGCTIAKKQPVKKFASMSSGRKKRMAKKTDAVLTGTILTRRGEQVIEVQLVSPVDGGIMAQFSVPAR
ncbi:MAG TPA: hypothetical protein DEB46_08920 [Myxococcales bacterium]|nr:hypothetical protein [Myxococcales bacterium]|tara:strand:- start:91 stop:1152 length:1062 start_codon:yes stop_codon:yes gene_type:complete